MIEIIQGRGVSGPLTATMFVGPASARLYAPVPTHLLSLNETFRPVWTVTPLDGSVCPSASRVASLTAALADGLLAWASAAAPALLAAEPVLDRHASRPCPQGHPRRQLSEACAGRVFAALAGKVVLWLALFDFPVITVAEVERARAAGMRIDLAVNSARVPGQR